MVSKCHHYCLHFLVYQKYSSCIFTVRLKLFYKSYLYPLHIYLDCLFLLYGIDIFVVWIFLLALGVSQIFFTVVLFDFNHLFVIEFLNNLFKTLCFSSSISLLKYFFNNWEILDVDHCSSHSTKQPSSCLKSACFVQHERWSLSPNFLGEPQTGWNGKLFFRKGKSVLILPRLHVLSPFPHKKNFFLRRTMKYHKDIGRGISS